MTRTVRYNYVIGDVQGCFEALKALLKKSVLILIRTLSGLLVIWWLGENSLGALRFIKKLVDNGVAATVLGNHDLTLLAYARGIKPIKDKDNVRDVIDAIDSDELIDWIRKQPMCLFPNEQTVLTHAGIPNIWDAAKTAELAKEVEAIIAHDDFEVVDTFLKEMFGKEPTLWSDELEGHERTRCIVNYLTRMRLTDAEGRLEYSFKDSLDDPMPEGFKPWFEFESKTAATHQIVFGHWAALQGKTISGRIQNVDGGCVWGNQLMAYRLEDQQMFAVDNPVF